MFLQSVRFHLLLSMFLHWVMFNLFLSMFLQSLIFNLLLLMILQSQQYLTCLSVWYLTYSCPCFCRVRRCALCVQWVRRLRFVTSWVYKPRPQRTVTMPTTTNHPRNLRPTSGEVRSFTRRSGSENQHSFLFHWVFSR